MNLGRFLPTNSFSAVKSFQFKSLFLGIWNGLKVSRCLCFKVFETTQGGLTSKTFWLLGFSPVPKLKKKNLNMMVVKSGSAPLLQKNN